MRSSTDAAFFLGFPQRWLRRVGSAKRLRDSSSVPVRTADEVWLAFPQPFLFAEARASGLSGRAVVAATRRGQLTRLASGLYAEMRSWSDLGEVDQHVARCRAAMRAVPDTVVSHTSAAVILGLPRPTRPLAKVSLVSSTEQLRTSAPRDWKRVLHGRLRDGDWVEVGGLRITNPARTAADCLRTLGLRNGLAIADAAARAGLITTETLTHERAEQRHWPGARQIDVGLLLVDGRRESWLESASVAVAWRVGISRPVSQVSIHRLDGSFIGRCDFLWPKVGVIGEADGMGKYRGDFDSTNLSAEEMAARVLAERDRERGLESLGFGVARWTNRDLWSGGAGLVRSLRDARGRARPEVIDCLWRLDTREPLRPWSEFPGLRGALAS